jgi:hypothetical protein
MMKTMLTLLALCLSTALLSESAHAGWTDWWKSKPATTSKSKSSLKKPFTGSKSAKNSGLKMPDVVGTVSNGTKRAYSNTKALLSPNKKKSSPRKITGSQTRSSSARDSKESTSTFGSLFASKKEPTPPKSISEWMSLPRLDP